jgi:hypothetical protein
MGLMRSLLLKGFRPGALAEGKESSDPRGERPQVDALQCRGTGQKKDVSNFVGAV